MRTVNAKLNEFGYKRVGNEEMGAKSFHTELWDRFMSIYVENEYITTVFFKICILKDHSNENNIFKALKFFYD